MLTSGEFPTSWDDLIETFPHVFIFTSGHVLTLTSGQVLTQTEEAGLSSVFFAGAGLPDGDFSALNL